MEGGPALHSRLNTAQKTSVRQRPHGPLVPKAGSVGCWHPCTLPGGHGRTPRAELGNRWPGAAGRPGSAHREVDGAEKLWLAAEKGRLVTLWTPESRQPSPGPGDTWPDWKLPGQVLGLGLSTQASQAWALSWSCPQDWGISRRQQGAYCESGLVATVPFQPLGSLHHFFREGAGRRHTPEQAPEPEHTPVVHQGLSPGRAL